MFTQPQKLVVPDVSGRTPGMTIQANWNSAVKGASHLRLKFGNQEIVVKRADLETLLFMLGDEQSQSRYVRSQATIKKKYKIPVQLFVTATKDIRKGEMVVVPYMKEVSEEEYEWNRQRSGKITVV